MLREIIIPKEKQYTITIPPEYVNRRVEILILPYDGKDESVRNKRLNLTPFCGCGGIPESSRDADTRNPAENLFSTEAIIREIKQTIQNPKTVHSAGGMLAEHLANSPEIPDPCFNVEEWNREWDRIETEMKRGEFAEQKFGIEPI